MLCSTTEMDIEYDQNRMNTASYLILTAKICSKGVGNANEQQKYEPETIPNYKNIKKKQHLIAGLKLAN